MAEYVLCIRSVLELVCIDVVCLPLGLGLFFMLRLSSWENYFLYVWCDHHSLRQVYWRNFSWCGGEVPRFCSSAGGKTGSCWSISSCTGAHLQHERDQIAFSHNRRRGVFCAVNVIKPVVRVDLSYKDYFHPVKADIDWRFNNMWEGIIPGGAECDDDFRTGWRNASQDGGSLQE